MRASRRWFAVIMMLLLSGPANAQWSSSKEKMTLFVPFAAGGAVDPIARIVADNVDGYTVIVENRSGAGGDIAVNAVARATPDGNTVLLHASSLVINAAFRGTTAEVAQALEPIARIGTVKYVLVVRKDYPAKSLQELVALAKSEKKLSYASTGPGTTLHIAAEMLARNAGTTAVHVPYRGLSPAFTDIMAGNVDFIVTSVIGVMPYIQSGHLRALAVFDTTRAEQLPDVPTTVELGFNDLVITNWFGVFVGSKVPQQKLQELEQVFLRAINSPKVQKLLLENGVSGAQNAKDFKEFVKADMLHYEKKLKELGVSLNLK